jgi:fibronectin type 3 domain-containing protein
MKKILSGLAVFTLLLGLGLSGCNGILGDKESSGIFGANGPWSGTTTILPVPAGVSAEFYSGNSYIMVSWNPVSEASSYKVYRSTSSNGYYSYVETRYSTSFYDYSGTSGQTYYYKVSAVNSYGEEGAQSSYASATFGGSSTTLPVPAGVSANFYSGYIEVWWGSVSGASSYKVYRNTSSSGSYSYLTTTSSTSYYDYSGISGQTYYYKVSAVNSYGEEGEQSSYASATFGGSSTTLPAPTYVSAYSYSGSGYGYITVSWNYVSGASSYRVYRSTSSSGPYSSLTTTYSPYYDDYSGTSGQTYYYKVSAVNSYGEEGEQSSYASATFVGGGSS